MLCIRVSAAPSPGGPIWHGEYTWDAAVSEGALPEKVIRTLNVTHVDEVLTQMSAIQRFLATAATFHSADVGSSRR